MRIHFLVPLALLLVAVGLLCLDIFGALQAVDGEGDSVPISRHRDDNMTFVAASVWFADPGDLVRTPGWWIVDDPDGVVSWQQGQRPTSEATPESLFEPTPPTVLVVPAGCSRQLIDGEPQVVYFEESAGPPLTFAAPRSFQDACKPAWYGRGAFEIVWLLRNDTVDYQIRSQTLYDAGIEGRSSDEHGIVAVDPGFLRLEPYYRWGAWTCLGLAFVASLWPRSRGPAEQRGIVRGAAGASIELASAAAGFLRTLRNAYAGISLLVLALGFPLAFSLALLAGSLDGAFAADPREMPYPTWQGDLWWALLATVVTAVVCSSRPAFEAHLALVAWRRRADQSPIEGDL